MEKPETLEKVLEEFLQSLRSQPAVRTSTCPSEENLELMCFEENNRTLRRELLNHVMLCKYCATYLREVIQAKRSSSNTSEIVKKVYPVSEEIDWNSIKSIRIFKDNSSIGIQGFVSEQPRIVFDISEPGFYHIAIETGQIIWRREILLAEILLSEEELDKAKAYGMTASTDKNMEDIVSFEESVYEGKLQIVLYKRLNMGILVFALGRK